MAMATAGTPGRRTVVGRPERSSRTGRSGRIAATLIALLVTGLLASAAQGRVEGSLVNRDGTPQKRCQLEFFNNRQDARPLFEAYTDDSGRFYLYNPRRGVYQVKVSAGGRSQWTKTTAGIDPDRSRVSPDPLVVEW